jgi:hypothetical protein
LDALVEQVVLAALEPAALDKVVASFAAFLTHCII